LYGLVPLEELDQISLFRVGTSALGRRFIWYDKYSKDGTHAIPYIITEEISMHSRKCFDLLDTVEIFY